MSKPPDAADEMMIRIMAVAFGGDLEKARAAFEKQQAEVAARDACELHIYERMPKPLKLGRLVEWKCRSCGWLAAAIEIMAYEQGLAHGRAHPTGGGEVK